MRVGVLKVGVVTVAAVLIAFAGLNAQSATLISGATVYTVADPEPIENASILVRAGKIVAIGQNIEAPLSDHVVDARGLVITPGLIDSYTQLGISEIGLEASSVDSSVAEFPMGPGHAIARAINPDTALIPVNRIGGITHAVVLPVAGNDPFAGLGAVIHLGGGTDIVRVSNAGMLLTLGTASGAFAGGSRAAALVRVRNAFADARRFNANRHRPDAQGYGRHDLLALKRFLASDAPLVAAVNRASDIGHAVALARDIGKRLILVGAVEAWKVADLLSASNTAVVIDPLDNLPRNFDRLGARLDNAVILRNAGVTVAFSAFQSANARRVRFFAGNAVANGLAWSQALAAITAAPAEIWGLDDAGTLAVGKRADLVVWNGDPLDVNTWAERVMIAGEWMPMRSRQTRLRERYRDLGGDTPFGYR